MLDERNVYAQDNAKNNFLTMTKEQILTAILQAVNEGTIGDIDAGFITKLKEMNDGAVIQIWIGTMAEYTALPETRPNTLYMFTDDPTLSDIEKAFRDIQDSIKNIKNGNTVVEKSKDVTGTIGGKKITDIFKEDGVTPKNAAAVNDIIFAKLDETRIQVSGAIDEQKTIGIYYKKDINHSFSQGGFTLTLDNIDITDSGYVEYEFYIEYEEYSSIKTVVFNIKFNRDRVMHDVAGLNKQMYPLCAPAFGGNKVIYIEPLIYYDAEDQSLKIRMDGVFSQDQGSDYSNRSTIDNAKIVSVTRKIY